MRLCVRQIKVVIAPLLNYLSSAFLKFNEGFVDILSVYMYRVLFEGYSVKMVYRGVFKTLPSIYDEGFSEKWLTIPAKKFYHRSLTRF